MGTLERARPPSAAAASWRTALRQSAAVGLRLPPARSAAPSSIHVSPVLRGYTWADPSPSRRIVTGTRTRLWVVARIRTEGLDAQRLRTDCTHHKHHCHARFKHRPD